MAAGSVLSRFNVFLVNDINRVLSSTCLNFATSNHKVNIYSDEFLIKFVRFLLANVELR